MKKLAIGLLLSALSLPAFANTNPDWTPFFKSWENGCDFTPSNENLFRSLTPDYDHWDNAYQKQNKNVYKPQKLILPAKYRAAVTKNISIVSNGKEFGQTWDDNLFQSKIKVKGTYYGLPMDEIGFLGLMGSGVQIHYFTVNASHSKAQAVLRKKAHIKKGYSESGDNPYPEMEVFAHPTNSSKTIIMCDLSN
ncbi:hypothetical protein B0181_05660 [Moraxella caviae]|uniref:Uncharacterized protein n=1 Tax=Moraxella caviae TaxID=34060 RepID=A0A1T0A2Y1_9GAMM|nr:hypothetical protein [Moraxella caviae]OOR89899.1 hypothetical protein B0181_05660 [Moraxella caviae]STZ14282.1 Uncharacterised protein [Moraxella caviae]VEW10744.1 Uncharacterised protein [Moraxella caviae]